MARQLPGGLCRLGIFGRAKGGRTGPHVNVAGEPAVHHRHAGADNLGQHDACHRLGMLLDQCARDGDRGHGTRQRKGGDGQDLPMGRERNQPLSHGNVQLQRRIGVDDAQQSWPRLQTVRRRAQHDCRHLDPVHGAGVAQRLGLPAFVEQPDLRVINIQMPGVGGKIQWLERPAAFLVQHV